MSDAVEREAMEYDVVIVGAGPSGLAAAIRLKQLNADLTVAVLEKGSEVGAHILSGAVIDPSGISDLLPNWKELGVPLETKVTRDKFVMLGPQGELDISFLPFPKWMLNHGNYIASLGNVCRWMATYAEGLGVEIYPGMAASDLVFNEDGSSAVAARDRPRARARAILRTSAPLTGRALFANLRAQLRRCAGWTTSLSQSSSEWERVREVR